MQLWQTLWLLSLPDLQNSALKVHVCHYLQSTWYHRVHEKKSKISKPRETFHEKMAQTSILDNAPRNGNCKTWKERKQNKPTCWLISPFLLCLKCNVYVHCTIHRCLSPSNIYMWWCHFPWIEGLPMLAHDLIQII